ncbi:hypothetical protein ACQV2I_09475 [Pantoea allii]|uniref:hypothetical protein n=1 Tax=Pantoea allii TaxID=574096 RepID=UPI003D31E394
MKQTALLLSMSVLFAIALRRSGGVSLRGPTSPALPDQTAQSHRYTSLSDSSAS